MVYETSYESGRIPFIPDTKRGHWANPSDFVYAGLGLAFRFDVLSLSWFEFIQSSVISYVLMYLISLVLYIIPFFVIQSFLGQFSSSGYISAFRLTPLFKGVGYVTLVLNICVLSFYSNFATVPLFYLFASMQPTLPWSCEGLKEWTTSSSKHVAIDLCSLDKNKTESAYPGTPTIFYIYFNHHLPSELYFQNLFYDVDIFRRGEADFSMSWQLIVCAIIVWSLVILIIYKFFTTERFGQIIRYTVWTLLVLLIVCLIRISFLPGTSKIYQDIVMPTWNDITSDLLSIPIYGVTAFGPGWGLFITLSSFNKFKTNIMKQSWLIGVGQMVIVFGLDLLTNLMKQYFSDVKEYNYMTKLENFWVLYLSAGSVMSQMAWANLWSILYYFMLFLSAMLSIIIQLYTILTTIFDEFVALRERKLEVCMGLTGITAVFSLYFTSNHGLYDFVALLTDTYVTQTAINLLLILIVLWIYGRVRFQRDIEFMINVRFATWKIYILRFVTPAGISIILMYGIYLAEHEHYSSYGVMKVFALIFIVIPWLLIPGYAAYYIYQSVGSFKTRFQRCCRPNDWYPVDGEERQRYEEAMDNLNITHQLNEITDNNIATI